MVLMRRRSFAAGSAGVPTGCLSAGFSFMTSKHDVFDLALRFGLAWNLFSGFVNCFSLIANANAKATNASCGFV